MKSKMGLAVLWSVFGYYLYFSLASAFNFAFSGIGIKFIDIVKYWMISSALVYISIFNNIRKKNVSITSRQLFIFAVLIINLIVLYVTNTIYDRTNRIMENALRYYFLFSLPAALCGLYAYKNITVEEIERWIDVIVLIFFLGLTAGYINWITKGGSIKLGGDTYQSFSYTAAYAVTMDIYMIMYASKTNLMKRFRGKPYNIIRIAMLPVLSIYLIAGGGRGAFVLLLSIGLFILIDKFALSKRWKEFVGILLIAVMVIVGLAVVINNNPKLQKRFERSTEFIDENYQIDLENGSSGRDKIYERSEEAIKKSPVFGYGPMGGLKKLRIYSHNVYYDFMLEGGVIYLSVWIIVFIAMFRRLYWLFMRGKDYYLYTFLFICPFTILQFSGYYIMQGGIWFFVAFLLSFNARELKRKKRKIAIVW